MPIDTSRYPEDWDDITAAVKERANHCCEHCGAISGGEGLHGKDGQYYPRADVESMSARQQRVLFGTALSAGVQLLLALIPGLQYLEIGNLKFKTTVLTTAHLDHDETNPSPSLDLLAALCEYCHLKHDRRDNALRRKYGKRYRDDQLELEL